MARRSKKNDNSKSRLDPMIVVALIGTDWHDHCSFASQSITGEMAFFRAIKGEPNTKYNQRHADSWESHQNQSNSDRNAVWK